MYGLLRLVKTARDHNCLPNHIYGEDHDGGDDVQEMKMTKETAA